MNSIEQESEIFKQLCQQQCVTRTPDNEIFLNSIKQKGLLLKTKDSTVCLQKQLIPLSKQAIYNELSSSLKSIINVLEIKYQCSSTNKLLAKYPITKNYAILATEYQTQGQGRRNKQWFSPLAANLCFSIKFQLKDSNNAQLLPLVTAQAICRALELQGITQCQIKWPNDVYHNGKKLAGILSESRTSYHSDSIFIVGIGLNVNMNSNNNIDQLWTSLSEIQGIQLNRNDLLSALLSEILTTYNTLAHLDKKQFMQEWRRRDYLYDSPIEIYDDSSRYNAIAKGIDDDGALLVQVDAKPSLNKVFSAEVSIKPTIGSK